MRRSSLFFTLFPCFVILLIGCGPSDVKPVTGTVTLDGEPLEGVEVRFTPTEGEKKVTSRGRTNPEGKYELMFDTETKGALVGKHLVQIVDDPIEDEDGNLPKPRNIPKKYDTNSDLSAEVTAGGENVFDFDLKTD